MPLFVVQHEHLPERCPAAFESGSALLAHISAATAARYGVAIQAEAVLDGEHRLLLVLEAASREQVERYVRFFGSKRVVTYDTQATTGQRAA